MSRNERGYSLIEMLVVVAIIAIVSLVTVPNFINMQRSAKMKTSLRQITGDIRSARQHAITKNRRTMISFKTGTTEHAYRFYEETVDAAGNPVWVALPNQAIKELDETVYFSTTNFPNTINDDALTLNDIIFHPTGTVQNVPVGQTSGTLRISTDWDIPVKQYTINLFSTGRITTANS
jgi:prepilin-type N-terminal cleavage/methylation domain-containing protein